MKNVKKYEIISEDGYTTIKHRNREWTVKNPTFNRKTFTEIKRKLKIK